MKTAFHMIDDVTLHPCPKESLPCKRQGADLALMTRRIMDASENFSLQSVWDNKLVNRHVHVPVFLHLIQHTIFNQESGPMSE